MTGTETFYPHGNLRFGSEVAGKVGAIVQTFIETKCQNCGNLHEIDLQFVTQKEEAIKHVGDVWGWCKPCLKSQRDDYRNMDLKAPYKGLMGYEDNSIIKLKDTKLKRPDPEHDIKRGLEEAQEFREYVRKVDRARELYRFKSRDDLSVPPGAVPPGTIVDLKDKVITSGTEGEWTGTKIKNLQKQLTHNEKAYSTKTKYKTLAERLAMIAEEEEAYKSSWYVGERHPSDLEDLRKPLPDDEILQLKEEELIDTGAALRAKMEKAHSRGYQEAYDRAYDSARAHDRVTYKPTFYGNEIQIGKRAALKRGDDKINIGNSKLEAMKREMSKPDGMIEVPKGVALRPQVVPLSEIFDGPANFGPDEARGAPQKIYADVEL